MIGKISGTEDSWVVAIVWVVAEEERLMLLSSESFLKRKVDWACDRVHILELVFIYYLRKAKCQQKFIENTMSYT